MTTAAVIASEAKQSRFACPASAGEARSDKIMRAVASPRRSKQKPRAVVRGFRLCASVRSTRSVVREDRAGELVVQAGANDVFLEADIVHKRCRAGVEAAEVDPEIFDLGRPVAQEGVFNTKAVDPAHLAFG